MLDTIRAFVTDDSGQALTEYALILALVSIGLILVLIAFRDELGRIFNAIRAELEGSDPGQVPVT